MYTLWLFDLIFIIFNVIFLHHFKRPNCIHDMKDTGRIKIPIYVYIIMILLLCFSLTNNIILIATTILLVITFVVMLCLNIFDEEDYEFCIVLTFLRHKFFRKIIDFLKKILRILNRRI